MCNIQMERGDGKLSFGTKITTKFGKKIFWSSLCYFMKFVKAIGGVLQMDLDSRLV